MLSYSRIFVAILNIVILICSAASVCSSWSENIRTYEEYNSCEIQKSFPWLDILPWTFITTIGVCASCLRRPVLEWIYLLILVLLTIGTVCYCIFVFTLLPKTSALATALRGIDGNWLREYNPTLQRIVISDKEWNQKKICYAKTRMCDFVRNASKFDVPVNLNYFIPVGCCSVPKRCGPVNKNETTRDMPKVGLSSKDEECMKWKSFGRTECYECDSCRAGYLAMWHSSWEISLRDRILCIIVFAVMTFLSYDAFNDHQWEEFDVVRVD